MLKILERKIRRAEAAGWRERERERRLLAQVAREEESDRRPEGLCV
jgi:hypothetical protein